MRQLHIVPSDTEEEVLRVAFATDDRRTVNQHFGSARSFVIYEVAGNSARVSGAGEFGELAQDGNEAKLKDKFSLLEGCDLVYCQAVGHSAVQQLIGRGIQPIKVRESTPIEALIEDLQCELESSEPPPWLARLRRQRGDEADRFDAMEEEGWEE